MPDTDHHQPSLGPVSWTTYSLLLMDWDRHGTYAGTQQAMNTATGAIPRAFGNPAGPSSSGSAWLIAGHRDQDPGAGR